MVKCNSHNNSCPTDKTRQKENRSEKVQQTKTETVKERGGNSPDLVSLLYQNNMKKSILLLIIIACVGCVLAFTVLSKFRIITLIISAVSVTAALIMALKNERKDK